MAAARCTICQNPKLGEIEASLAKVGTRKTARRFKISLAALDRHKRHATERQLAAARTPQAVLTRLSQLLSPLLRREDASMREEFQACIESLGKLLEENSRAPAEERNLDREIAKLVSDATLGFEPREIARLKALVIGGH